MGGGSKSASERWKSAKKLKAKQPAAEAGGSKAAEPAAKGELDRLTSLADKLLSMGEFGIYEDTYEGITFRISQEAESHGELLHSSHSTWVWLVRVQTSQCCGSCCFLIVLQFLGHRQLLSNADQKQCSGGI